MTDLEQAVALIRALLRETETDRHEWNATKKRAAEWLAQRNAAPSIGGVHGNEGDSNG